MPKASSDGASTRSCSGVGPSVRGPRNGVVVIKTAFVTDVGSGGWSDDANPRPRALSDCSRAGTGLPML